MVWAYKDAAMIEIMTQTSGGALNTQDPRLPGLSVLLDPEAMKETYFNSRQGQIPAFDSLRPEPVTWMRSSVWYRPGKQCSVVYAIRQPGLIDQRLVVAHTNSARAHDSLPCLLRAAAARHSTRQGIWIWEFPNDPALPWLGCLADLEALRCAVPDGMGVGAQEYRVEVLRYAPLKRCTFRVNFLSAAQEQQEMLVAKIDVNGDPAKVHAVMTQLWEHRLGKDRRYGVAKPLGDSPADGLLWQYWCPGERFADAAKRLGLLRASRLVAEALADLHQTPIEGLPRHSAAEDQAKLTSRARALAEFHPSLAEPVRRVASRLAESAILSDSPLVVPLHGDFNDGQILFQHERPIILDFDACALGDPHYDLGHFIAALFRLVNNRTMSEADLRSAEAEFQHAYQANVPWNVSRTRLRHCIALALICRRAHKALRRLEPNAIESIRTFVAHAEAYLVS